MFLCCFLLTVKLFQGIQWILHTYIGFAWAHRYALSKNSAFQLRTHDLYLLTAGHNSGVCVYHFVVKLDSFLLKKYSQHEDLSKLLFLRSKGFYKWPGQTMKKFGEGLMAESFLLPRPATWTENLTDYVTTSICFAQKYI